MNVTVEMFDDPGMMEIINDALPVEKRKTMTDCFKVSNAVWCGFVDHRLACIWGVTLPTIMSNKAYLWLWTTDIVKEHPFVFIRRAQIVVKELLEEYELIVGVVNTKEPMASNSIRWLKLLGAKFSGVTSKGLIPFEIRKLEHG